MMIIKNALCTDQVLPDSQGAALELLLQQALVLGYV
jgi:hypothetical protein